jgi:hypothetical protein
MATPIRRFIQRRNYGKDLEWPTQPYPGFFPHALFALQRAFLRAEICAAYAFLGSCSCAHAGPYAAAPTGIQPSASLANVGTCSQVYLSAPVNPYLQYCRSLKTCPGSGAAYQQQL